MGFRQMFIEEGKKEGRQEGRQEGELLVLKRQLMKRFGSIPEWVEQKLAKPTASELDNWIERILFANSIEDVFNLQPM